MGSIHENARTGFHNAQKYDTHRPSYPAGAVQSLLGQLEVAGKPQGRIIDLAAGTGKLTEVLARRDEQYQILAVEPHPTMRQTLANKNLRGVQVQEGTAQNMEVSDGWADAVIVAQAFHWFSNMAALKEIHRVLKPGGKLGVVWNVDDYNKPRAWKAQTQWEEALNVMVHNLPPDGSSRIRDNVWRQVFEDQGVEKPLFSTPLGEDTEPFSVRLGKGALWDRMSTLSQIAILQGEEEKAFRAQYEKTLKEGDCDWNEEGEVAMHGVTYWAWTTRL